MKRLNAPPYINPDDAIGFITRVYPGVKENGSISVTVAAVILARPKGIGATSTEGAKNNAVRFERLSLIRY